MSCNAILFLDKILPPDYRGKLTFEHLEVKGFTYLLVSFDEFLVLNARLGEILFDPIHTNPNNCPETLETAAIQCKVTGNFLTVQSFSRGSTAGLTKMAASNNISNGNLVICLGGSDCSSATEKWDVKYTANINGGILTSPIIGLDSKRIDGETEYAGHISGDIVGAFIGNGIVASDVGANYVGGFNLFDSLDTSKYVSGTYLLGTGDFMTADELVSMKDGRYGMFATAGNVNTILGGRAISSTDGEPVIVDNALWPGGNLPAMFENEIPSKLLRIGTATASNSNTNVGGLRVVSWGAWLSSPGDIKRAEFNSTGSTLNQNAYWFVATPDLDKTLTGKVAYSNIRDYLASGSGTVKEFGFVVNFSTGAISDGHLSVTSTHTDSAIKTWDVDFASPGPLVGPSGALTGNLSLSNGKISNSDDTLISNDISGSIGGMFVKDSSAFVSVFTLSNNDPSGDNEHVSGTVLAGKETYDWGDWNNSVVQNFGGTLASESDAHFDELYKTSNFFLWVLKQLKNSYDYDSPSGSGGFGYGYDAGGSSTGRFDDVNAAFNVNFETGQITRGELSIQNDAWGTTFDGQLTNGNVTFNPLVVTSPNAGGSAQLEGAFTGFLGNGFVGAFTIQDGASTGNSVSGIFDLQRGSQTNNPQ